MTATPSAVQQFQRTIVGQPFTASYTWGLDGDSLPDEDSVTYAVVDSEGTSVATGTASAGSESGGEQAYTFALTAADLPERDLLTVTWSYTVSAVDVETTSQIDVCDRRLFPLSDYSQFQEITNLDLTDAQLEQGRRDAEDLLERECGCAFTGRYGTEKWLVSRHGTATFQGGVGWDGYGPELYRGQGPTVLTLRRPFVQKLRSITRAWVDPESGDSGNHALTLDYFELDPFTGEVHALFDPSDKYGGMWGELTFAYEHGREWLADVRRVCLILARYRLLNGPLDARATQMSVEGGGTINLLTPGVMGAITAIPDVDVFIHRYSARSTGFLG